MIMKLPMTEMRDMLEDIRLETASTRSYTGLAVLDEAIMAAMASVPRAEFVPQELAARAYVNGPLPIGQGQTISQPFIVALMTALLRPRPDDVMLEIGTGSGYQAAILAGLVRRLYSMEIIESLARAAADRLGRLGYRNVEVRSGDGYAGWPEHAPYDGIIVTAAAPGIPPELVRQLKPGARLVIPVGPAGGAQSLQVLEKGRSGEIDLREVLPVAFVPLTGRHADEGA